MAPALVVLAGVEDAAMARPESHHYLRFNSQHSYHINFSLVSTCLKVKLLRKTMSRLRASVTTFVSDSDLC